LKLGTSPGGHIVDDRNLESRFAGELPIFVESRERGHRPELVRHPAGELGPLRIGGHRRGIGRRNEIRQSELTAAPQDTAGFAEELPAAGEVENAFHRQDTVEHRARKREPAGVAMHEMHGIPRARQHDRGRARLGAHRC
jgi:hypothetical protein